MQDKKGGVRLLYKEKDGRNGKVKVLKDQGGNVKFIKIGFRAWQKVEGV